MNKLELKIIKSIDTADLCKFIEINSSFSYSKCCSIVGEELDILTHSISPEDEEENIPVDTIANERIFMVLVDKLLLLEKDFWLKKFTLTQGLTENYYILFTN